MKRTKATLERQCGFTLMEVLVALVVFSIGLLGIATLQMTGMKQTHNSHIRSVAVAHAQALAERMRTNPSALANGDYNVGAPGAPLGTMPTAYATDCGASDCTDAEMAVYDLVQWNDPDDAVPGEGLDDALPQGVGVVCVDSTPDDGDPADWRCDYTGDVYAIKVQWTERGLDENESDTATERYVMRVSP